MIAHAAMRTSRRTIKFTCNAPLHAHRDTVYLYVSVQGGSVVIFAVLVRRRLGDDARVHESGQSEIGQHEKRDDSLVGEHPWEPKYIVLRPETHNTTQSVTSTKEEQHLTLGTYGVTTRTPLTYSRVIEEQGRRAQQQRPGKSRGYISGLHIALGHYVMCERRPTNLSGC